MRLDDCYWSLTRLSSTNIECLGCMQFKNMLVVSSVVVAVVRWTSKLELRAFVLLNSCMHLPKIKLDWSPGIIELKSVLGRTQPAVTGRALGNGCPGY